MQYRRLLIYSLEILLLFLFPLFLHRVEGAESSSIISLNRWDLGLGGKTDYIGQVQTTKQGSKNSFDPELTLLGGVHFVAPYVFPFIEGGSTIPGEGRDPNITRFSWFISGGAQARFDLGGVNALGLKIGGGLTMTTISSKGGEQILRNGNREESFPMPSGTTITRNSIAVFGINYDVLSRWRFSIDYQLLNAFNQRNRAWNSLFSLHYLFDFPQG